MPVTYENPVRGVFFLLLIISSITDKTVSPTITMLAFIAFEYMVRKLEKPIIHKDHSKEIEDLQKQNEKLIEEFKQIKGDISIAKIGSVIRRG